MRFSVVTPVMNGMPWLRECVASVDSQRSDAGIEVEHLVYDAGSTDGSREWLAAEAKHAVLVFERDDGQTDALARGFARASGEVLLWLNSDDLLEPHALARAATVFRAKAACVGVSGACLVIDPEGAIVGAISAAPVGSFESMITERHNPPQPATFFRRSSYLAVGGLNRSLYYAMDVDLWLKLAKSGDFAPMPLDVLARFRLQPRAKTQLEPALAVREDFMVRRQHGMMLRSRAALSLLRDGYVEPARRELTGPLRKMLNRALSPRTSP